MSKNKVDYDCSKCPGYCCSYPRIVVSDQDIKRLAKHFGLAEDKAKTRFTRSYVFKSDEPKENIKERILKHKKDRIYATICRFFDQDLRRCTVYEARPDVCRQFPDGKKCGYYTFLKFERKHQGDQDFIPSA
jgi:Fe-S-cluster containining protein